MSAQRSAAGTRIVLTRSADDCVSWATSLRACGFETVSLPCIETEPMDSAALRIAFADALKSAHWLVFTSQRGAAAAARLLDRPVPENLRIAVVGEATAQRTRALFGHVDFTAAERNAAGLARELAAFLAQRQTKIVLALAENAGNVLTDTLQAAGQRCLRFDVYRTVPVAPQSRRRSLAEIGGQTVFLASPSAVLGFVNQIEVDSRARLVSIGPTTTAAIERAGLHVFAQAQTPSLRGMLEAIED